MNYSIEFDLDKAGTAADNIARVEGIVREQTEAIGKEVFSLVEVTWSGESAQAFRARYVRWAEAVSYFLELLSSTRRELEACAEAGDALRMESESLSEVGVDSFPAPAAESGGGQNEWEVQWKDRDEQHWADDSDQPAFQHPFRPSGLGGTKCRESKKCGEW